MNLSATIRAEQKLLLPTYDRQRVLFTCGRGVYLWDSTGKRYLDFLSGIGVNALGHASITNTRQNWRSASRKFLDLTAPFFATAAPKHGKVR